MTTMGDIEQATKGYAEAREVLAERVRRLEAELEQIKRQRLPGIKSALARAAEAEGKLRQAIEAAPELFERPKSLVVHGVRVGFKKMPGKLTWDNEEAVVARIRKLYPEQGETLLIVTTRPSKAALVNLPASDLRRLGVTVVESGDVVLINPIDSEVDRLVDRLLRDAVEETQEAA